MREIAKKRNMTECYMDEQGRFIHPSSIVYPTVRLGQFVIIGEGVWIADNVTIKQGVTLGRKTVIQEKTFIGPHTVTLSRNQPWGEMVGGPNIGKNVWIGPSCVINAGIEIADNTRIGANSFVKDSITEPGLYCGSPAVKKG